MKMKEFRAWGDDWGRYVMMDDWGIHLFATDKSGDAVHLPKDQAVQIAAEIIRKFGGEA